MASGFRFDPPQVELSAEECWVLVRGFGPAKAADHFARLDGEAAVEAAERLDLAERIGSRLEEGVLVREVGRAAAEALRRAHTACAARGLIVEQVCRELVDVSVGLGVPAIFLKGAALQLGGWTRPGSRTMSDIDVLLPLDSAREYEAALIDRGSRSPNAPESEHQLQLLAHPTGVGIEVHTRVRGVRVDGDRSASADDLLERNLYRPVEALSRECLLPVRSLLIAHALVHGIAQHGFAPDSYPFARFLADLQDLGVTAETWSADAPTVTPWIDAEVSLTEARAVVELLDRLRNGDDPRAIAVENCGPAKLLQHLISGTQNDDYVRQMRLSRRARSISDQPRWFQLASATRRNLWLSRAQVDRKYGKPGTAVGYVRRRLWRPFELAGETLRDAWAWIRHRLRQR